MEFMIYESFASWGLPMLLRRMILALVLNPGTVAALADTYQPHESIRSAVRTFVLENGPDHSTAPEVEVGRLDSRLRLTRCSEKLEAFAPPGRKTVGRTTVGVRCNGNPSWSLYVPLTVRIMDKVLVANRDLRRGEIIARDDVKLQTHDLASLHAGYLSQPVQAVGKRVKRRIRLGKIIKPAQIDAVQAVKKGTEVAIVAKSNRIKVSAKGEALGSGGPGDRISVRNLQTNKVLEATIITAGLVQVAL